MEGLEIRIDNKIYFTSNFELMLSDEICKLRDKNLIKMLLKIEAIRIKLSKNKKILHELRHRNVNMDISIPPSLN